MQEVARATEHRIKESFQTKELNDIKCLWCENMVFYITRLAAVGLEKKRGERVWQECQFEGKKTAKIYSKNAQFLAGLWVPISLLVMNVVRNLETPYSPNKDT